MNTHNRQVIALHIGNRGIDDARKLWDNIPPSFQQQAGFFTDFWKAYNILDEAQHFAAGKDKGFVNRLERFNCTLRQRCSRLVRKALLIFSFCLFLKFNPNDIPSSESLLLIHL
jgi:insertion element IS1 protein InsB